MCLLWSVLRCQVFVAGDPTVFNVRLRTNNDMQMSLHLSSPLPVALTGPHWHELGFSFAQRFIVQQSPVKDGKIKYGVVTTLCCDK